MYGSEKPPEYKLEEVTCPVLLFWGQKDWMAQPRGVAAIAARLPRLIDSVKVAKKAENIFENLVKVADEKWNHLDFMWGQEAPTLLFPQILEVGFSSIIYFQISVGQERISLYWFCDRYNVNCVQICRLSALLPRR